MRGLERFIELLSYSLIALIIFGNLIYAYQCIFQTRKYIKKYGFGEGSAIMTRLVGTFAAGFAVTLAIALFTSIEGAWLLFFMVLCRHVLALAFAIKPSIVTGVLLTA